ncbi:MAG: KilA, N-terminal/APSES-type DNA-binding protein [Ignavibacteria bacterium]|nr:KilA, N-terminal/APSES-type DNA-binding protein [Ignavibacteria bacterium]
MSKSKILIVKGTEIILLKGKQDDFISLTDIAKVKNPDEPRYVVQNWMKTRYTVDFLGFRELLYNPGFNRVEFDAFKNEAGSNAFVLTPLY